MNYIMSELNKIKKNYYMLLPLLVNYYFIMTIYQDSIKSNINFPGYLISCTLYYHVTFGVFFVPFSSSYLLHKDIEWKTIGYMYNRLSRPAIFLIKELMTLIFSIFILLSSLIFLLFICIINNNVQALSLYQFVPQFIMMCVFLFSLGSYSLLFTSLTGSYLFGSLLAALSPFYEAALYELISPTFYRFLPLHNFRSICTHLFDNLKYGSFIIVGENNYPSFAYSIIYYMLFMILPLLCGYLIYKKKELKI